MKIQQYFLRIRPMYVFVLALSLVSCGQFRSEPELDEEEIKYEELHSRYKNLLSDAERKYKIKYYFGYKQPDYKYTIQFDSLLNTSYQIIERPNVHDIFESNDTLFMSVRPKSHYSKYQFDLSISKNLESKVTSTYLPIKKRGRIFFIINTHEIKKISSFLDVSVSSEYDVNTSIQAVELFLVKGTLVDLVEVKF